MKVAMKMRGHQCNARFCASMFVVLSIVFFLAIVGSAQAHKSKKGSKLTAGLINISTVSTLTPKNTGGQAISNLIDGNLSTTWVAKKLPQKIVLDLGFSKMISSTRIAIEKLRGKRVHQYSISISLDSVNWVTVAKNRKFGKSQWAKASFTPVNARYIKVSLNYAGHTEVITVRDIEIYGRNGNSNNKSNQKITLKWLPSPGYIQGYLVFYGSTAKTATAQVSDLAVNSPGFNSQSPSIQYDTWLDLYASPGDNVCFRVRSYGAAGLSKWSSAVCGGV